MTVFYSLCAQQEATIWPNVHKLIKVQDLVEVSFLLVGNVHVGCPYVRDEVLGQRYEVAKLFSGLISQASVLPRHPHVHAHTKRLQIPPEKEQ